MDPWREQPRPADQWYDPHQGQWYDASRGQWYDSWQPGPSAAARAGPPAARPPEPDDDGDEEDDPSWMPALAWTVGCFLVPVALYLVWAATRSGTPPPDCLDDRGAPCPAPRTTALGGLVSIAPGLIGAVTLALLVMVGLRLMIDTWRPAAIGIAAAVVGAGTATLIATVVG